jgi:hypothetical protein
MDWPRKWMALQWLSDTRPLARRVVHQRVGGRMRCDESKTCDLVQQRVVQILVVVATIQPRTLKTEEEKVSM